MAVLNFCLSFAEKCPKRENNVYEPRIKGEISLEWFPNYPLLFELAEYEADKANSTSDEEALANA